MICLPPSLKQTRGPGVDLFSFLIGQSPAGPGGDACPSDRATSCGVGVWPCALGAAGQDMERDQDRMWGLGGHWEEAQGRYLREREEEPEHGNGEKRGGGTGVKAWQDTGRIRDRM